MFAMVLKHILCINVTKIIFLSFIHSLNNLSTSKNVPYIWNIKGMGLVITNNWWLFPTLNQGWK